MENENHPQNDDNQQDVLNYYRKNYKSKECSEIIFENYLEEAQKKSYIQFHKSCCCCIKPLSLLIFSIIILAITCAGFFFSISKNKGYKAYKGLLERNMSLIDTDFPNEYETIKLMYFLTKEKNFGNDCTFFKYSEGLCTFDFYSNYCTPKKKSEEKCNYMDYQYYLGYNFDCTLQNYENGLCSQIQYFYELEKTGQIYYEHKIKYISMQAKIYIKDFFYEKIWCKIGDYDQPIYLSFLILMVIFIALLIFDLIVKIKTLPSGVRYYIAISFYMIYQVIFKIYCLLFLILSIYGIFVSFLYPSTYSDPDNDKYVNDPFLDKSVIIIFPEEKLWKDKRLSALIFCGISFILFLLVCILSCYKKLIYDYLSFYFYEKNNDYDLENISEINRSASIKVGKNNYYFQIKQNKDLYLKENKCNKKHAFKEIIFQNNIYYLKCDNYSIKDQLSWSEFRYPKNNEITFKLNIILNLIYVLSFFFIFSQILNFDNNKKFDYYIHLIDLGYKPKNTKYIEKSYDLNSFIKYYIIVFYIGLGIISILSIAKWTFFGGFKNIIFIWVSIFISIIIILLNFGVLVLSIIGFVFNFLGSTRDSEEEESDIEFENDTIFAQLIFFAIMYMYVFIFALIEFIFSILFLFLLNKIKNENQRLETEKKSSENIFKFLSLKDQQNWILEAINDNPDLPKYLFYQKKLTQNPMINFENIGESSNIILCMEQNVEEIFDEKQKIELKNYKYKPFGTKLIISKIIYQIIFSGISFIVTIIAITYSFHGNKYYKAYRDYYIKLDKYPSTYLSALDSLLYGYNKFWVDFGNYENSILISFLIFLIFYLLFEILSLLIHKNIIKLDYNNGFFYNLLLLVNIGFYILFKIFFPLFFFLFIFSILVINKSPNNPNANDPNNPSSENSMNDDFDNNFVDALEKEWNDKKSILIVNIICKLFLTIFSVALISVKYSIINYLNKNYEVNEDEDEDENQENDETNEVKTSLILNNNKYETQIKLNHVLHLQPINDISKDINNKNIFKFKKLNIVNLTNSFVYMRLGLNSVTDQISLSEWNYPDLNLIFSRLADMCNSIYIILFFSVPLFKMHVEDELIYHLIKLVNVSLENKKPKFSDIFNKYGSYEKSFTESRFILYLIQLIIILLFMLKRIYFGGFKEPLYLLISFILCIICLIDNIIYVIMDFLTILFTIFSITSFYDHNNLIVYDEMTEVKFFVQLFINLLIFIFNIILLKETVILTLDYNKIKKAMNNFINKEDNIDENNPNFKPIEFKYISLEGNLCSIIEYRNTNLQRYLFYSTENTEGNIQDNTQNASEVHLRENIQINIQEDTELNNQKNAQLNNQENAQDNNIDKNSKIN